MHRFSRLASFVATAALLHGCPEVSSCGEGRVYDGTACVPRSDAGDADATPMDAAPDVGGDAGPCGGACDLDFCEASTGTCLDCRVAMGNADCTTPAAPICSDGSCERCGSDADCDRFTDARECGPGGCVACTPANEVDVCPDFTCDPATGRCTDVAPHDRLNCETCVADSQCPIDHRCVPMFFGAGSRGAYCLKDSSSAGGCEPPYSTLTPARTSLSGVPGGIYCGIREDLTTCEATIAFATRCRAAMGESCPTPGSLCRTVGATTEVCTYPCTDPLQCPDSRTCPAGADRFCQ